MNETTIWEQRCPLCEGVFFKEYRLGLLHCESCGLVLSPLVWQSQIEEHMEREWFGDGYVSKKLRYGSNGLRHGTIGGHCRV